MEIKNEIAPSSHLKTLCSLMNMKSPYLMHTRYALAKQKPCSEMSLLQFLRLLIYAIFLNVQHPVMVCLQYSTEGSSDRRLEKTA
jgi:hypothetical protein